MIEQFVKVFLYKNFSNVFKILAIYKTLQFCSTMLYDFKESKIYNDILFSYE